MLLLALNILQSGVPISMLCAIVGLIFAFILISSVIRLSPGNDRMRQIAAAVQEGAKAYLNRQVITISAIAVVIFILLLIFRNTATGMGFLIGATCSLAAGFIGMRIAVLANVRTAQAATQSRSAAMRVAFNGGAVTGLLVVGLALLSVGFFYTIAKLWMAPDLAVKSLVGLALGSSLISVFARLGGGIYTKAADVGADLVGKIESNLEEDDPRNPATIADNDLYFASLVGLLMPGIVVIITNYYTSTSFAPVRKIAKASETGHATNIIAGLAIGQHATALPVGFIGIAILFSFHFAGLYGIAIAVMSMLSMAGIIISLDAFGPITDNAGGIAVMSHLGKNVRSVTDELDAVGNTMKAVTKGYAIASAGLAALVLFGSYVEELSQHVTRRGEIFSYQFSLSEPKVIIGLFIGGLLPFIFTAFSMDAVSIAAGAVVREVRRQLKAKPGILTGQDTPDYGTCVDIVTKAALRQMIIPALLPLIFVVAVAMIKPL